MLAKLKTIPFLHASTYRKNTLSARKTNRVARGQSGCQPPLAAAVAVLARMPSKPATARAASPKEKLSTTVAKAKTSRPKEPLNPAAAAAAVAAAAAKGVGTPPPSSHRRSIKKGQSAGRP